MNEKLQKCIEEITLHPETEGAMEAAVVELESTGLNGNMAVRYLVAAYLTNCEHGRYPPIVSGYRSPERQLELISRWNAGKREGLVVKPAERSWHMQGLAVDVAYQDLPEAAWKRFIFLMTAFGCRWGGAFRMPDPVHFDLPIGRKMTADQLIAGGHTA